MDMDIVWDKMKKFKTPAHYFSKLSLTQQVLVIIFSMLLFLTLFFNYFLSNSIDVTITNRMFNMMASRQEPIISILESKSEVPLTKEIYYYLASDSILSNCLIEDGKDLMLSHDRFDDFYLVLIDKVDDLVHSNKTTAEEKVMFEGKWYYYRLQKCHRQDRTIVVSSYMDDTYATEFRDSLVDSTVYVTVLAFFLILMVLMAWVFSIIHPLNQIRAYIAEIKQGKDVELRMNREDEIGEVANELQTMKDELLKQEKTKEEMIHNISHDLKTPIATIKSYSESIKDGIYPYGDLDSSVDVILDNAQRLEDKVHSLLYLNRVEYLVTSDSEGVVTNMKEVVEQVVLNSAVLRPEINVITDVEEVFFDGLLESWRVAIENIMENAFRYAETYIKIVVRENDLRIYNDGKKMPEDRIESLFKPYEKGEGGRFGLGLSIVSKVTKANKYRVKGYNTDDGVCFRIYRNPEKKKNIKVNKRGRK